MCVKALGKMYEGPRDRGLFVDQNPNLIRLLV